jgi:hypothetical protein
VSESLSVLLERVLFVLFCFIFGYCDLIKVSLSATEARG